MTPLGDPRILFDCKVELKDAETDATFQKGTIWKVNTESKGVSGKSIIELEEITTGERQYVSVAQMGVLLISRVNAVVLLTKYEAHKLLIRSIGSR